MHRPRNAIALDRRRLLTGAVASASAFPWSSARAQEAAPTPVPIRIQTPDLAFVDAIQAQMDIFQSSHSANNLLLSIVSAEPASDSLLNDLRLGGRRFSGAFVPYWLIPDLVRDGFIAPAKPPPVLLPPSLAVLRSFGGAWVATDFDHDCDLLYTRLDLIGQSGAAPTETWDELLAVLKETNSRIALPRTRAEQIGEHFASMAASYAGAGPFWFQPESMDPLISSEAHQNALRRFLLSFTGVPRLNSEPKRLSPVSLPRGMRKSAPQSYLRNYFPALTRTITFITVRE